jgi:hypothetical protein
MSENTVEVKVTASSAGLASGLSQATSTVESSTSKLQGLFTGMQTHITGEMGKMQQAVLSGAASMQHALIELGFAIGSGALIKEAVSKNLEYTESLLSMSRMMGITTEQAGVMTTALTLIGSSSEAYVAANLKLDKSLKTNEKGLQDLGVATRDANGSLLDQQTIFNNALGAMMTYKEGVDRNEFALSVFGKGAKEAMQFLKLNNDVMQEAETLAHSYGLAIGQDAAKQTEEFGIKLRAAGLIFDGVKLKIGQELLPVLVQFAGWMGQVGPGAIAVVSASLKGLIHLFEGLTLIVRDTYNLLEVTFKSLATLVISVMGAIGAAMRGDFTGAKTHISDGLKELGQHWATYANDVVTYHAAATQRVEQMWAGTVAKITDTIKSGTKEFVKAGKDDVDHQAQMGRDIVSAAKITYKLKGEALAAQEAADLLLIQEVQKEKELLAHDESEAIIRERQRVHDFKEKTEHDEAATQERLGKNIVEAQIRITKGMEADAKARSAVFTSLTTPVVSAFHQMTIGILRGNQTLAQSMHNLATNVAASFADLGLKMLEKWVANQIAMTTATATESAARTGIGAMAAAEGMALQAAASIKSIMNSAYQAMAGTIASLAGFGADVSASAGSIVSARGGWDVPRDSFVNVHKNEMILPSALADRVRTMTSDKGGSDTHVHLHVQAIDAQSVTRLFQNSGSALADVLRKQVRNNRL